MNNLKKEPLRIESEQNLNMSFGDAIEESTHIGAVISELLIPFLLIQGYTKINSSEILPNMDPTDEIVSVEWPTSAINGLTDYDVIFANTKYGKRFAISAKFEEGNKPSLIGKMYHYEGDFHDFRSNDFQIMMKLSKNIGTEFNGTNNYLSRTIWEIASAFNLNFGLPEELTYESVENGSYLNSVMNEEYWESWKEKVEEEYPLSKGKIFEKWMNAFPYSLTILFERMIAQKINSDKRILKDIYNLWFNFYPGAEFQQIEMDKNLNLKYITQIKTPENVYKTIEVENNGSLTGNDSEKALNQNNPLGVKLS